MWTLVEGVTLANRLEKSLKANGFHCALGGSVLHSGASTKDLDIFVYPHTTQDERPWSDAEEILTECGCELVRVCKHKYDNKRVREYKYAGKRIDFFFVK